MKDPKSHVNEKKIIPHWPPRPQTKRSPFASMQYRPTKMMLSPEEELIKNYLLFMQSLLQLHLLFQLFSQI